MSVFPAGDADDSGDRKWENMEEYRELCLDAGESEQPLQKLLREAGYFLPAPCGGNGICRKCLIQFLEGAPEPTERDRKACLEDQLKDGWRLACQAWVRGRIRILLPAAVSEEVSTDRSAAAAANTVDADLTGRRTLLCEKDTQIVIHPLSGTRISSAAQNTGQQEQLTGDGAVIALDIGTTTLAAVEVDPLTGKPGRSLTSVNHQRVFGADVISRIQAAVAGQGEELQRVLWNDIEGMIAQMGHSWEDICLIISCNTTMGHLLQGYSCAPLGKTPYKAEDISCHTFSWKGNDGILFLPGVSAFVGADIVSGMTALGMSQSQEITLLVDVGTNGELALGNCEKILVTSAAAGPAFEGGNISCGMAAVPGAVSRVHIHMGKIYLETIEDRPPIGICGTGVLDMTCELLRCGFMESDGRLQADRRKPEESQRDVRREPEESQRDTRRESEESQQDARREPEESQQDDPVFVPGEGICLSRDRGLFFTQKDIREVQYAKSAIRTGIEILLREYGITCDDVARVYLAGSFGQAMDREKAIEIGLLPEIWGDRTIPVGNTSLLGAVCLGGRQRQEQDFIHTASMTREIRLAEHPDFLQLYLQHMWFPEHEKNR